MDGITNIDKQSKITGDLHIEVIKYDADGNINNDLSDQSTAAMIVKIGNGSAVPPKTYYKVKARNGGRLFDPNKDKINAHNTKRDLNVFKMKEVGGACFNTYIRFLSTKLDSLKLQAERDM